MKIYFYLENLTFYVLPSLCSHYWVALKQGTKPCNHFSGATLYWAAVINESDCVNTKQTGEREHTCWVDYWLNELRPNRQIWSAFSRLLVINWGGGSCWRIVNKTSLLFFFSRAWLLTRAVDFFCEFTRRSRELLWEAYQFHLSSEVVRCFNKDGIKAFSPWLSLPRSCFYVAFAYSLRASKLASVSFHTFVISYSLPVPASDTLTFLSLSYSFSDSLPQAQNHVW